MKSYTYIVELGFDKFPFIFIDQVLNEEEKFEELIGPVWEYICSVLTYNKEGNKIVLYRQTKSDNVPLLTLEVRNDFSELVDKVNHILVEIHSKIIDEDKNIVESANFHVIIYKNAKSENTRRIDKKLFRGELE